MASTTLGWTRLVWVCAVVVMGVSGRSDRVPPEACDGMKPLGHGAEPQISLPPYYIDVIPPTVPNQAFQVVLAADDPSVPFMGFFIKAFDEITGKVVGSFTRSSDVGTIDCGASGFGAHHTSSTPKTSVILNWQPSDYTGSVSFMATVVQSFSVYWVGVVSPSVAVGGII
ncbi:hypothetical protein Pcinc_030433 [Petrolisthes cinctipes]|uniref:Reelin domain-containing protein n=1 Tax=Petrolisthes cinctipes TaxID=88211 RepID=A0AAE1K6B9_PETCI|nr:hypothetical protein Pcinc_030433 [Petrolisthes cinctipes]